jgi:homoserine kinase
VQRIRVSAPASSANLGPGYDCLAVALPLRNVVSVERRPGPLEVTVSGEGAGVLPCDAGNLVVRSFAEVWDGPLDGLVFRMRNDVPLQSGTGSSSAAIVAGLTAGLALQGRPCGSDELIALAAPIEGHPDNVAAALFGGFVVCAGAGGTLTATRLDPPQGVEAVVVIPDEQVPTEEARKAIPDRVPMADAVANISAAAELVLGIQRSDLTLIGRGLADRLHQPQRAHLYPRSMEIVQEAPRMGAIGATISGAGPTVLVWTFWQSTGEVMKALNERVGDWAEVRRVPFSPMGADVPEL